MSDYFPIRPDSPERRLGDLRRDHETLSRRGDQRRMFITPIAPATVPDDYIASYPLYGTFAGPWANIGTSGGKTYDPSWFRVHAGGLQIYLAVTGGEGSPGSTVATYPANYPAPTNTIDLAATIGSGGFGHFQVNPDRTIVFVSQIVGTPGTPGTNGTNGSTWYSGSTVPSSGLGVNGDFYYRTGTNTVYQKSAGTWSLISTVATDVGTANLIINGNGATPGTGVAADLAIDFDCTLLGWHLLADLSGSIVIDVWKKAYASFPPTVADTLIGGGGTKPTLSSAIKNVDTTLTGWTTTLSAGDILRFNVDSASTVTRVTLALKLQRR